jgi:hypothetical protein
MAPAMAVHWQAGDEDNGPMHQEVRDGDTLAGQR